jgi:hypothetical protein
MFHLSSRTYKNLEKRVILECDGETIPLPSLQGIVVLNIQSFMGGTNFWGSAKADENIFLPPGFDDGILEVSLGARTFNGAREISSFGLIMNFKKERTGHRIFDLSYYGLFIFRTSLLQ